MPVYCQYKFQNFSMHRTNYYEHGTNIHLRDVNVVLAGSMTPQEFQEFLDSPTVQIEVRDRDRKVEERQKTPSTWSDNDMQSNASTFDPKMNTYGIANLNLSELLLGKKSLEVDLPIKCGPQPLKLDRHVQRRGWDSKRTDTAASRDPMPQPPYYDLDSRLKVKVEMACPLTDHGREFYNGPFGRIVYLIDNSNFSVITKLRSEILRINVSALKLDSPSLEIRERALNSKHYECMDLDFVTGFHVQDKRKHIFVLEGLQHKAVRRLWEAVPMK